MHSDTYDACPFEAARSAYVYEHKTRHNKKQAQRSLGARPNKDATKWRYLVFCFVHAKIDIGITLVAAVVYIRIRHVAINGKVHGDKIGTLAAARAPQKVRYSKLKIQKALNIQLERSPI